MNKTELTSLAYELADEAARADIECYCRPVNYVGFGRGYYIALALDGDDAPVVKRALKYLDARGLLERCPDNRDTVRIRTS